MEEGKKKKKKATGWKKMKTHAPHFTETPLNLHFITVHPDMTEFSETHKSRTEVR
jgi:hypothetical protein